MITGFAMFVSSVMMWATGVAFQSYKARLERRLELDGGDHLMFWFERVVVSSPLKLLKWVWRYSWTEATPGEAWRADENSDQEV